MEMDLDQIFISCRNEAVSLKVLRNVVCDLIFVKIHFHTNEPWKVLEYCNTVGEIYDIVVEDMIRQSNGQKG